MKAKNFNDLIGQINDWGQSHRFEGESLVIPSIIGKDDLSTLTDLQRNIFKKTLRSNQVSSIELSLENTINFSKTTWKLFLEVFNENKIEEFILSKEPIWQYTATQWKILFAEIEETFLRKIGFHFSDFYKMNSESCSYFFQGLLTSKLEQLDLSYSRFGEATEELYKSFFKNLATCINIKSLVLSGNALSTSNQFWRICTDEISKLGITQLRFDDARLFKISESNWLNFCKGLECSKINYLSLQNNCFYNFKIEQWKCFFQGLSSTFVKELDLKEHHSLELNNEKWEAFCNGLRETLIIALYYEHSQFNEKQKEVIEQILKENQKKLTIVKNEKPDNSKIRFTESKDREHKENTNTMLKTYELKKRKIKEEQTKNNPSEAKRKKVKLCNNNNMS